MIWRATELKEQFLFAATRTERAVGFRRRAKTIRFTSDQNPKGICLLLIIKELPILLQLLHVATDVWIYVTVYAQIYVKL